MNEVNEIVVFVYSEDTKDSLIPPNVTHVKVDPSVKEIRENAFFGLTSLVDVEFSEGRLEVIGIHAFAECRKLRHTNQLPSTLKDIGACAFLRCYRLETLVLPQGLRKIGSSAFRGCRKLKEIKIPSSRIAIGDKVFAECASLTSVVFPVGLQIIGEAWFQGCSALVAIEVPSSVIKIHKLAFTKCKNLASLDFKEGLEDIGDEAFLGCKSIVNVHLPSTLCRVGSGVFRECERLESCILPEDWTMIADRMFSGCSSLADVAIPESVTSIGELAFSSCTNLQHVRIPSRVFRVGRGAFYRCGQLKSVNIKSDCLAIIEQGVFKGCVSLTHLRLPSSITKLESGAFSGCSALISLEFPKGLEAIFFRPNSDVRVFDAIDGCRSLVNLVVPAAQQVDLDGLMADTDAMDHFHELARVSCKYGELIAIMKHRFDNKPVHERCYYQSYYSVEDTRRKLDQAIHENPSAVLDVDAFGMTPFHILALSQTPMLPLFEALLDMHDVDMTALGKDKFGNSPMDYLCMNYTPECTVVIRSLLQKEIGKRTQWLGLSRWRNEIVTAMDEAISAEWSVRRQAIEQLTVRVAELEWMEAVSLLELAIWKMKIKDVPSSGYFALGVVADRVNRESCRFNSGAGVIIPNILLFLNKVWPVPMPSKRRRLDR